MRCATARRTIGCTPPRTATTGTSCDAQMQRLRELGHHGHRRPLSLRRPVVARRLPGSRLPGALRGVRARLRAALSVDPALHAGERDLHRRELLRAEGVVERVREERPRLRARHAQPVHGARAGGGGDPLRAARRDHRAGRVDRALPRGGPRRADARGAHERDQAPVASTSRRGTSWRRAWRASSTSTASRPTT